MSSRAGYVGTFHRGFRLVGIQALRRAGRYLANSTNNFGWLTISLSRMIFGTEFDPVTLTAWRKSSPAAGFFSTSRARWGMLSLVSLCSSCLHAGHHSVPRVMILVEGDAPAAERNRARSSSVAKSCFGVIARHPHMTTKITRRIVTVFRWMNSIDLLNVVGGRADALMRDEILRTFSQRIARTIFRGVSISPEVLLRKFLLSLREDSSFRESK